jgi:hypothetical protein
MLRPSAISVRNIATVLALAFVTSCGGAVGGSGDREAGTPSGSASSSGTSSRGTCTTNADCPSYDLWGFPESAGCAAVGACFSPRADCQIATGAFCACDGTTVTITCGTNGLPSGYETRPYAHSGNCQ